MIQVLGELKKELDKMQRSNKQSVGLLQVEIYPVEDGSGPEQRNSRPLVSCLCYNVRKIWGREGVERGVPLMIYIFD
jgi:hypothetical protein